MQLSAGEEDSLLREGAEALRQGRATEARARFERLAAAGSVNALTWLLLAISCRHGHDPEAEEAALNRLLELRQILNFVAAIFAWTGIHDDQAHLLIDLRRC